MPRILTTLFACLLIFSNAAFAAPTTPTSDFTDNKDGTVTHKITGLTWERCAEGQTWTGTTCSGTAQTYTWADASALTSTFAGKSDWRLPTIAELVTIVERSAINPAINGTVFPNTPASSFWSASAYAGSSGNAWLVYFLYGFDGSADRRDSTYVRLVRGGQIIDLRGSPEYTPTSDFTDHGNGSVTHNKTSLTWMRCAEGQSWNGATCTGSVTGYTWADATALTSNYAGYSDWRLPTQNELLTIVEWGTSNLAINTTIFPKTAVFGFWSASPYAEASSEAWGVNFYNGRDGASYKSAAFQVRLVRGGQSLGASSAMADCLFNWAEKTYPQYFSLAGGKAQTLGEYYYRQYVGNTYLAISSKDNHLYYILGGGIVDAGLASQWYAQAGCQP